MRNFLSSVFGLRSSVFYLSYLISHVSFSQTITIKGEAKSYSGKEIKVVYSEDFITETEKELNKGIVNDSGYFQLSFNSEKIKYVWIKSENAKSDFHAEPGKTYDVILFPKDTDRYVNSSVEQLVELGMLKTDTNEINYLIADFNKKFEMFWEENYKYFVVDQFAHEKVNTFKASINKRYSKIDNPYFHNYITYKIAGLEDAASENRKKLFTDYIHSKPLLYDSYEYMSFLGKYYTPAIRSIMMKDNYINALSQKTDFKNFVKLFKTDKYLTNDTIRELIAIKALYVSYNYPLYTNGNILHILQKATKEALTAENRKISENIVKKISRLVAGAPAPEFSLMDKNDKLVNLTDLKGKYVYIDFWATWCGPCLAEMKLMPELQKEYGNEIEFISISIDDNIEQMKQFLKKNPQYNWKFLYTGSKGQTKDDYMVYSVPAYYLINSFGNIIQSPAEKPSEGVEKMFDEITRKLKK